MNAPAEYADSPTVSEGFNGELTVLTTPPKAVFAKALIDRSGWGLERDEDVLTVAGQVRYQVAGEDEHTVWADLVAPDDDQ